MGLSIRSLVPLVRRDAPGGFGNVCKDFGRDWTSVPIVSMLLEALLRQVGRSGAIADRWAVRNKS